MHTDPTPELAEQLSIALSDDMARTRSWESYDLKVPIDDIRRFLRYIPGSNMLDVGCGWAGYIQHFLDHGLTYTGIDHSLEMIKVARAAHPGVRFLQASYRTANFPDEYFDGIWACCAFSTEPKSSFAQSLARLRKCLTRNGIMTIVMPGPWDSTEEYVSANGESPLFW